MEPGQAIPNNWFRDRTLLLGVTGTRYAHAALDLLERLAGFPGCTCRVVLEEATLQYVTRKNFERFGNVQIISFADDEWILKYAGAVNGFVLCDLEGTSGTFHRKVENMLEGKIPVFRVVRHAAGVPEEHEHLLPMDGGWDGVLEAIAAGCAGSHPWENQGVLVTAGRTEEAIDPVRMITNRSSGRMGFALARQAALQGAKVTLITGPANLRTPYGVTRIDVRNAEEMREAAEKIFPEMDVVFAAAAVEDLKPVRVSREKIKKQDRMCIECTTAVDVLQSLGQQKRSQYLVGFSVETEDLVRNSREKLERKRLDAIVANNPNQPGAGFQHDTNQVTVLTAGGTVREFPLMSKEALAGELLELTRQEREADELRSTGEIH